MKIRPRRLFTGDLKIPGDKSITHRAILFNGIASGEAVVTDALLGADCLSSVACMRALGAQIEVEGGSIRVRGAERLRAADCDCGNSGTTMRLLMGLVAGMGVEARLTGDASLSRRPMERVAAPLRLLGADIATTEGHAPVAVRPARLHGCTVDTHVASAQVKSALILAALGAEGETTVREPLLSRDHTERMLAAMGADIRADGCTVTVRRSTLHAADVAVPADISSAAYFMALGALCGETLCRGVGVNPTRTGILTVFDRMGVDYALGKRAHGVRGAGRGHPRPQVRAAPPDARRRGHAHPHRRTARHRGALCLCGRGERHHGRGGAARQGERPHRTTAAMLTALGGDVTERPDGFVIRGRGKLRGGRIDACADHRIAMSGAVALAASEAGGEILGAECVDISFPGFFTLLDP